MKKIFYILSILSITAPVFADDDPASPKTPTVYETSVATAAYVRGAYDALTSAKQEKLTSTNVTTTGTGPVVTSVTANNGAVSVTAGEITIPVGSASSPTGHAQIWIE